MNRDAMIAQLKEQQIFDIVIIGGGATGLGAAVDAASRGYATLLIEQYDFGKGTSSRSTKLVHGGVRYLAQGNIKLVKEALRERGWLLKNAPHLTSVQPFIVPVFSWWEKIYYSVGLKIYDLLAGKLSLGNTLILNKKETLAYLPSINPHKLVGGILYFDGQFNDSALCTSLAITAAQHGAVILNYVKATGFIKEKEIITGVELEDTLANDQYAVKVKSVINATGVFTDAILHMDQPTHELLVTPSQGIHLVIDASHFKGNHAMMIPKTDDGRVLFAVPWQHKIVVGTTDTPIHVIDIEPKPLAEEIEFVIEHFNRYTNASITRQDVKTVFVGLRPLVKSNNIGSTALLSRDHTLVVSPSRLVTITGGKWTTYRKMGQDAVDNAIFVSKQTHKNACRTQTLAIGNELEKQRAIESIIKDCPALAELLHPQYPYIKAEVVYATRYEMAITVEDFLARRIRLLFLDAKAAIEMVDLVAVLMSNELHKDSNWVLSQKHSFETLAQQYLLT
jgi:glycerol-3-phosphate dehydrogenase